MQRRYSESAETPLEHLILPLNTAQVVAKNQSAGRSVILNVNNGAVSSYQVLDRSNTLIPINGEEFEIFQGDFFDLVFSMQTNEGGRLLISHSDEWEIFHVEGEAPHTEIIRILRDISERLKVSVLAASVFHSLNKFFPGFDPDSLLPPKIQDSSRLPPV